MEKLLPTGLYYMVPRIEPKDAHDKGELIKGSLFTEDEVNMINDAAKIMDHFVMNMQRTNKVEKAYTEFKKRLVGLNTNNRERMEDVDYWLCSYFVELRKFLNLWEKDIKIGITSGQFDQDYQVLFQKVTANEFDNNDDYLLAYVLRNYIEHFGTALQHIHINGKQNQLCMDRDDLLQFNITAHQRDVIIRQEEEIDLVKVVDNSFEAMGRIHQSLVENQITDKLKSAGQILSKSYKKIVDKGLPNNNWVVFKEVTPLDDGKIDVSYRPISWQQYLSIYSYIIKHKEQDFV